MAVMSSSDFNITDVRVFSLENDALVLVVVSSLSLLGKIQIIKRSQKIFW